MISMLGNQCRGKQLLCVCHEHMKFISNWKAEDSITIYTNFHACNSYMYTLIMLQNVIHSVTTAMYHHSSVKQHDSVQRFCSYTIPVFHLYSVVSIFVYWLHCNTVACICNIPLNLNAVTISRINIGRNLR